MSIISDHSKFTEIFDSISVFSTKIEDKINNFLRNLRTQTKYLMKFTKNFTLQAPVQVSFMEVQKSTSPTFLRRFPSAPFSRLITRHLISYRNLLSLLLENLLSKIHTNLPTRYKDFQMQIIILWHPLTLKTFILTSPFLKLSIFVLINYFPALILRF